MMNLVPPSSASQGPGLKPRCAMLRVYLSRQGQQQFAVSELVYLQSHANYTWLFWTNGRRMLLPRTLKYVESKLPDNVFVRLHRHHTVNSSHVTDIYRTATGLVVKLSNGKTLDVARRRRHQVLGQFQEFVRELKKRPR